MDSSKLRLRHEWHMRWPHLSLGAFWDDLFSMQATHSTDFTIGLSFPCCLSLIFSGVDILPLGREWEDERALLRLEGVLLRSREEEDS
jgi:hypothetical protein